MPFQMLPESLVLLQKELTLPQHSKLAAIASKEQTFSAVLGSIAASLDIALDGDYEVEELCSVLLSAMRSGVGGAALTRLDARFQEVEMMETGASVQLVPIGTDPFSLWMQEQGCEVCMGKAACLEAERCLGGDEALEESAPLGA
jgi:hypothetical protein